LRASWKKKTMRRPTQSPFHPSDLGGPFQSFAPKISDGDEAERPLPDIRLYHPARHRRASILSRLIDALRRLRSSARRFDDGE
jgi:hypothetical protein